jgi:DNA ligase-1
LPLSSVTSHYVRLSYLAQVLLEEPFCRRRALLRSHFPPMASIQAEDKGDVAAWFDHVRNVESTEGREAVEAFWQEAVESRCEGLMVKASPS